MEKCPACQSALNLNLPLRYCPFCGYYLGAHEETPLLSEPPQDLKAEAQLKNVGHYTILKQIAKGGWGREGCR